MKISTPHIRNPLTIISIFAGIAETAGSIILPIIDPEVQKIYVWFLMLFPPFLITSFFLTLNFNHKTLYAPSDFENQENFMKFFAPATYYERAFKLEGEMKEVQEEDTGPLNNEPSPQPPSNHAADPAQETRSPATAAAIEIPNERPSVNADAQESKGIPPRYSLRLDEIEKKHHEETLNKLKEIESLAINKLSISTQVAFSDNVKYEVPGRPPLVFDAVADHNKTIHIAEIKYFSDKRVSASRFESLFARAGVVARSISSLSGTSLLIHLIVVTDHEYPQEKRLVIAAELKRLAHLHSLPAKVYITTPEELRNPYRSLPAA